MKKLKSLLNTLIDPNLRTKKDKIKIILIETGFFPVFFLGNFAFLFIKK